MGPRVVTVSHPVLSHPAPLSPFLRISQEQVPLKLGAGRAGLGSILKKRKTFLRSRNGGEGRNLTLTKEGAGLTWGSSKSCGRGRAGCELGGWWDWGMHWPRRGEPCGGGDWSKQVEELPSWGRGNPGGRGERGIDGDERQTVWGVRQEEKVKERLAFLGISHLWVGQFWGPHVTSGTLDLR